MVYDSKIHTQLNLYDSDLQYLNFFVSVTFRYKNQSGLNCDFGIDFCPKTRFYQVIKMAGNQTTGEISKLDE